MSEWELANEDDDWEPLKKHSGPHHDPREMKHIVPNALKAGAQGAQNLAGAAYQGVTDLPDQVRAEAADVKGIPGRIGQALGKIPGDVYRAVRHTPALGPMVEEVEHAYHADRGRAAGKGEDELLQERYKRSSDRHKSDEKHAKDHPLTDFVQRTLGVAALPANVIAQAGVIGIDAFHHSRAAGNDTHEALRDARNATLLAGGAILGGHGFNAGASKLGKFAKKEFGISDRSIETLRANPKGVTQARKNIDKNPMGLENDLNQRIAPVHEELADATRHAGEAQERNLAFGHDIHTELAGRGKEVSGLSGESFDRLIKAGTQFDLAPIEAVIKNHIQKQHISGSAPREGHRLAAMKYLEHKLAEVREAAAKNGGKIPPDGMKEFVQDIQTTAAPAYDYALHTAQEKNLANLAVKLGKDFNIELKAPSRDKQGNAIPGGYAEKMDELAPKTNTVNHMKKIFGTVEQARAALAKAANPNHPKAAEIRDRLQKYDEMFGTDFHQRLKENYDEPAKRLIAAKQQARAVNLLGPNQTEKALPSIGRGKNHQAERQLQEFAPDLHQQAMLEGAAKNFDQSTTNGSRRVAAVGALAGGVGGFLSGGDLKTSGSLGSLGLGVGGAAGFLADRYGGRAVELAVRMGINLDKLAKTPYVGQIMDAAIKGDKALKVAHYILSTSRPDYPK